MTKSEELLKKLQEFEKLEKISNLAEIKYDREPDNIEYERAFDESYKNEYKAFINLAEYIVFISNNKIDFNTAKKMIQTKRRELFSLLS